MASISQLGRRAWRKWAMDGVSSSGANKPDTADIFPFVDAVGSAIDALLSAQGAAVAKADKSSLDAVAGDYANGDVGIVYSGPDRGIYKHNGVGWVFDRILPEDSAQQFADAAEAEKLAAQAAKDEALAARDQAAGYVNDIVSEKEVPIFSTISGLASINVDPAMTVIQVNGRASATDAQGGLFTTTNTGSNDTFSSGDGRTWYRVSDDRDTAWFRLRNKKLLAIVGYALLAGTAISIACQGDSLTYGQDTVSSDRIGPAAGHTADRASIQYPARMHLRLNACTNSSVNVINMGFSGDTAKLSYQRWTSKPSAQLVILMLGTNDANGMAGATFSEYCLFYEAIVRRYIQWGIGVVIATPNAVSLNNANISQAQFGQFAKSLAEAYGCPVFDSVEVLQYCYQPDVYSDSIHLNKYGYAKFGDAIASFLMSGVLLQPARNISSACHFQPMRGTEGIGAFMTGGTFGATVTQSYVISGAAMGIAETGGYSQSFYLDAEVADVYIAGAADGVTFELSAPVDASGKGINRAPMKNAYQRGALETTRYIAAQYIPGGKTYVGTLVGRGWKTIRLVGKGTGNGVAYINEFFIEPKDPREAGAGGVNFNAAREEITVFNKPAEGASLPTAVSLDGDVIIPLPAALFSRSNDPGNYAATGTVDVEILAVGTPGGANNGIRKFGLARMDNSNLVGIWQQSTSNAGVPLPTAAGVGFTPYDQGPGSLNKTRYPTTQEQGWLWLTFSGTPAGYYKITFKSAAQQGAEATALYAPT
ncbi:SGNH/GDSL hydrolase family protein [Agrobacterium sp. Ap1]|uniref:SGNH/GDSL hydrolase family protein n=1 Tax=Agrobacterium sp. Ap1 TaxID=2815337 RepID=UPI001A90579B|nr:SGNH/GDSL hydrolase family protein [Agrobacterium sp. Ap1]MBO0141518.1 SGNH/GDSL hydrolase family protein [Agrobacterium sp. Ap1]